MRALAEFPLVAVLVYRRAAYHARRVSGIARVPARETATRIVVAADGWKVRVRRGAGLSADPRRGSRQFLKKNRRQFPYHGLYTSGGWHLVRVEPVTNPNSGAPVEGEVR